jgi:hypothetical protein
VSEQPTRGGPSRLLKAGSVLVLETGDYSDYSIHGPFRVLKDFDQLEAMQTFITAFWQSSVRDPDDRPDADAFIGWLNREQFIADIEDATRWHIGDPYGTLDTSICNNYADL